MRIIKNQGSRGRDRSFPDGFHLRLRSSRCYDFGWGRGRTRTERGQIERLSLIKKKNVDVQIILSAPSILRHTPSSSHSGTIWHWPYYYTTKTIIDWKILEFMIAWSYYCHKLDGKHKNTLLLIVNEKKKRLYDCWGQKYQRDGSITIFV